MTSACASVGLGARLSNLTFGSPSISRANGLPSASMVPSRLRGSAWLKRRFETPVFALDECASKGSRLPRIWITEPAYDRRRGHVAGREFVASYPNGADAGGAKALRFAQAYFAEALGYAAEEAKELRRDCFRAAEVLFLHAAARGSVEASVKLGAIYAADLCEGLYWEWGALHGESCRVGLLPLQARAFERFSFAAVRGNAEACWQLGEMLLAGRGCTQDARHARCLFERAWRLASEQGDAEARGNAALRLARMNENAVEGPRDLKRALAWYGLALESLEHVLFQGAWHYKRACHEARMGLRRVRQEMNGGY